MLLRALGQPFVGKQGRERKSLLVWLCFAALTFVAYIVLVLAGSGGVGLLWIVGFVVIGWPTMAIGATTAIVLPRTGRNRTSPSFRAVVSLSLLGWGAAAMALELGTTTEYLPAALLWIAAPTVVAAGSIFGARPLMRVT